MIAREEILDKPQSNYPVLYVKSRSSGYSLFVIRFNYANKEVDGGNIRGKVELEIEKKDFDRFLENFRNLGKLIASRDSGVRPETNWCDLDTAPVDHIRALVFD